MKSGYHVFALDYRGFGDSSGYPTETGVVKDVITLYKLVKLYQPDVKIFLYGKSLGTGIMAHAAKIITSEPDCNLKKFLKISYQESG